MVDVPDVGTLNATNIEWDNGTYHATLGGIIFNTGGENPSERGFQWGLLSGIYPYHWDEQGSFGTGTFYHVQGGFSTKIYYRAFATNSEGTGFGTEKSFDPPGAEPPDPPTNVTATDGTYPDKVRIAWTKSSGATGYQVYRDGTPLGWLGDVAQHDDYGADAPTIIGGSATASDGAYTGYVRLELTGEGLSPGSPHTYKVKARNDGGESGYSNTNDGNRGGGTLEHQWYRSAADSNGNYSSISGATYEPYLDTEAPAPTVTPGTAAASDGDYTAYTRLTLSGESANNGAGRYYKCLLSATGYSPVYSGYNRGYRGVGSLARQWYKSAGDSDATYSQISGGTTDPYNYTGAPAPTITPGAAAASDGTSQEHVSLSLSGESANVGAGRYYKCRVSASGASSRYSTSNRGYRGVGTLTYQWQRSAIDSDANYSNIDGATTENYDDTGAPSNGDGRYYKCVEDATGAAQQTSTSDRGYRIPTVTTMIGGPGGWTWGTPVADESIVRITTDGGMTWAWGVASGTITIPDGGPTSWTWEEHEF